MTDDLIQRLRDATDKVELLVLKTEAADALEAKEAEIERLREEKQVYKSLLQEMREQLRKAFRDD